MCYVLHYPIPVRRVLEQPSLEKELAWLIPVAVCLGIVIVPVIALIII